MNSEWRDGHCEVFITSEIKFLHLGVTVPAGTFAKVCRRIAADAAEVEWRGVRWTEIFIREIGDDRNIAVEISLEAQVIMKEMLETWEEHHGVNACDCRPEPENRGHCCVFCKARMLLLRFEDKHAYKPLSCRVCGKPARPSSTVCDKHI
jgi:hypothetical protein